MCHSKKQSKNPFKAIADFYERTVKKQDRKGFADYYKYCTKRFLSEIQKEFQDDGERVHFSDIEYLDGYFIFGFGTNSVVHFHIDECPGWKFAIWWDEPDKKEFKRNKLIKGTFFTQYEKTIDKFKTSRSQIRNDIEVRVESNRCPYVLDVCRNITFIRDEPYLAFCRDYKGFDYNVKFVTREEAEDTFHEWETHDKLSDEMQKEYNAACIKFMQENVLPEFKNAFIIDEGECVQPRYSIVVPLEDNSDEFSETGCHNLGDEELENRYNKLEDDFEERAREVDVWLDRTFDFCCDVVGPEYKDCEFTVVPSLTGDGD